MKCIHVHVPIFPVHQRFLHFVLDHYTISLFLSFGLSSVPRMFSKMLAPVFTCYGIFTHRPVEAIDDVGCDCPDITAVQMDPGPEIFAGADSLRSVCGSSPGSISRQRAEKCGCSICFFDPGNLL